MPDISAPDSYTIRGNGWADDYYRGFVIRTYPGAPLWPRVSLNGHEVRWMRPLSVADAKEMIDRLLAEQERYRREDAMGRAA